MVAPFRQFLFHLPDTPLCLANQTTPPANLRPLPVVSVPSQPDNSTEVSEMSFRKCSPAHAVTSSSQGITPSPPLGPLVSFVPATVGRPMTRDEAERDWFAGLLWRAFPEATSENHLSELAADTLTADRRPVTARTVRNWLRRENTPHYRYVLWVLALAGAERVFDILDPETLP